MIVLLIDSEDNANLIHFSSARCRRVTRSVMAAELHALVLAFDFGFVIREMVAEVLQRDVAIEALVDSKTVFDVVAKDAKTSERRLQIDVHALRESYARGELTRLGWIPGNKNPADTLTKISTLRARKPTPLDDIIRTNSFVTKPTGWAQLHSCSNESGKMQVS